MADQVDSMSDAELRTKLAEHGFPIMPITASTRKLLVKKLKLVLDNKAKPRASVGAKPDSKVDSRRTLARYSSGEDSDVDSSVKEKKNRRATVGGSMLPPLSSRTRKSTPKKEISPGRDDIGSESEDEKMSPLKTHEEVETVTTRRITRTYKDNAEDYETGSDSDVDMVDVEKKSTQTSPMRSNSRSSDYISSTFPSEPIRPTPPKPSLFARPSLVSAGGSHSSSFSAADNLDSIRSRLGLTSSFGERPSFSNYASPYKASTSNDKIESPYLSNFTKRLSSLNTDLPRTSFIDREINNGSPQQRKTYIAGVPRLEVSEYKSSNDRKFLQNNYVSLALVAIVVLFFFCLFSLYLFKRNDISSLIDDQSSSIPICQLNIPGNRPGINCVPKDQVNDAKNLLNTIRPEMTKRAAAFKCQNNILPYLRDQEIIDLAGSKAIKNDIDQFRTDLNNLHVLLVNNPQWGVSVVQLKNIYNKDGGYSIISSMDEVVRQRNKGNVALTLTDPSTPFSCLLSTTLYSFGSSIIIVGLLTALGFLIHKLYKYYIDYKKQWNDEVYSMVEQIIDVISQETEDNNESYISCDHVRDTLISPQNREKMASIWDAAVKFIQKNESRVRMEVQCVDGEECKVWRWVSTRGSPLRSSTWQGQAFETQEGSVNNLKISPTPCLKIRQMFDKNDMNPDLRSIIQDAILEKCGDSRILHIDLDRNSACVYVKCATQKDAGIVFKNLHGWWYEGKLITVKYLHLERYMVRFPNSPSDGPYLKPRQRSNWVN